MGRWRFLCMRKTRRMSDGPDDLYFLFHRTDSVRWFDSFECMGGVMVSINSTERRRRIRRAQELRAAFMDFLGVVGLAFAAFWIVLYGQMISGSIMEIC